MNLESKISSVEKLSVIQRGGHFLIIEPSKMKWVVLNENLKRKLDQIRDKQKLGDLISKAVGEKEIECFYDAGLVLIDGKSKEEIDFYKDNAGRELSLIVLHTSNACNFRCTYCYLDAGVGNPMSVEIAKKTLDRVAELHGKNPVTIEFHGGESLVYYDFVKQVVKWGNARGNFRWSIQTNASLIDEEVANFFRENNFKVGISIDGPKDKNDVTRVYKNGKGTYGSIMRGIRILHEQEVKFGAIMVVTDIAVVDEVDTFMLETGIKSLKLNFYFSQGRGKSFGGHSGFTKEYAFKTLALIDRLVDYNVSHSQLERLRLGNASIILNNLLGNSRNYMCMRNPCGAGISMFGVDFDGSVYPCEEMIGKKELVIGNIRDYSFDELKRGQLVQSLIENRRPEGVEDCGFCAYKNACEVTCANKSHNRTGGFQAKSELCSYYKIIFPEMMWKLFDNPEGVLTLL